MMPAHLDLRHAIASDLDALLRLERATEHAPHWPRSAYVDTLASVDPRRCMIVASLDTALVGFAVGLLPSVPHVGSGGTGELESVVVAADSRRVGVGRALCKEVFEWCQIQGATEMILEVRAASVDAIALYRGLGFEQTGLRPRYYRDPEEDAVIMRLRLEPSGLSE